MKILFLPENIASIPALTAAELNKVDGVEAISLTQTLSKYHVVNEYVEFLLPTVTKRKPFKWLKHKLINAYRLKKLIEWADVVHYNWSSYFRDGRDIKWAYKAGKPIFVEWVGSDIRNPDFLASINPYYKHAFENGYEYANIESTYQSAKTQSLFAQYGAIPFQTPEMNLYIDGKLFPQTYPLLQRLNLSDFKCRYPAIENKRPLIVHSPTAKIGKGSNFIIPVIDELKKDYDFDFRLLHDIPRAEVLAIMEDADIFLDQIIVGSYGLAATEAMAMGKPVMAYIMPEVFNEGLPIDCPIYNTNPDNLRENLITLISDSSLRNKLGVKSRAFAEKYHDLSVIVPYLIETYKSAITQK